MRTTFVNRVGLPIVLAAILATGLAAVWVMFWLWSMFVVSQALSGREPYESLVYTVDGQVLLQSMDIAARTQTLRTLDGQLIPDPSQLDFSFSGSQLAGSKAPRVAAIPWYQRLIAFPGPPGVPTHWYLVYGGLENQHAYFLAFDVKSKAVLGYLGPRGFRLDAPPIEDQFAIDSRLWPNGAFRATDFMMGREPNTYFNMESSATIVQVVSDGSVHTVDLKRQTVRQMNFEEPVVSIGNFFEPRVIAGEREVLQKHRLVIRFRDHLSLWTVEGEALRSMPLPEEIGMEQLTIVGTKSDEVLVVANSESRKLPTKIYWIAADGKITRHIELDLFLRPPKDYRLDCWAYAGLLPSPVALAFVDFVSVPHFLRTEDDQLDLPTARSQAISVSWLSFLLVCVVSAVAAGCTYRHHRQLGYRGAVAWAVFVFFAGLPGLAGYWLHRRWPARQRCAQCGAIVPRDREDCQACAAEFPAPALKGVEVFA